MNQAVIPFFSAPPPTRLDDYEWCRCTWAYIRQRAATVPDKRWTAKPSAELLDLVEACGYARHRYEKFRAHRAGWHSLSQPIPWRYLHAIGVEKDVLECCLEQDQKEYDNVRDLPALHNRFIVRHMPTIYSAQPLPSPCTDEEAIETMHAYVRKRKLSGGCYIHVEQVRSVHVYAKKAPDGTFEIKQYASHFRPSIDWARHQIRFASDGSFLGSTRLK